MSDIAIAKVVLTKPNGEEVEVAPSDLKTYLEKGIRLDTLTASIKVSRSIPRDKFEKNEYFQAVSTNLSGAYALAGTLVDSNPEVRTALAKAIVARARKAFDLSRVLLREQQEADGLTVVSLGEATSI